MVSVGANECLHFFTFFIVPNKSPWGRSSTFRSFSPCLMLSTLLPVGQTGRALKRLTVNLILLSLTHLFFGTFFPHWRRSKVHVGISRVRTETFPSHSLQLEGRYLDWNFLMRISSYLFVSQSVQNNLSWCSVAATSQRAPPTPPDLSWQDINESWWGVVSPARWHEVCALPW